MALRCFVAADVASKVVKNLNREIGFLQLAGADVRWVPPQNMHVTVRFIGDVRDQEVPDVIRAVGKACEGIPPCRPLVRGISTFPPNKPPRVVVAGVEDDVQSLKDLFNALQASLAEIGFRPEKKGLRPHVTLGRVKGSAFVDELQDRIAEGADRKFGMTTIDRVNLLLSEQTREGPLYSVMEEFSLGG